MFIILPAVDLFESMVIWQCCQVNIKIFCRIVVLEYIVENRPNLSENLIINFEQTLNVYNFLGLTLIMHKIVHYLKQRNIFNDLSKYSSQEIDMDYLHLKPNDNHSTNDFSNYE